MQTLADVAQSRIDERVLCCPSSGGDGLEGVTWFVQVSDLHFSRFAAEQLPKFGDKVTLSAAKSNVRVMQVCS